MEKERNENWNDSFQKTSDKGTYSLYSSKDSPIKKEFSIKGINFSAKVWETLNKINFRVKKTPNQESNQHHEFSM